MGMLAVILSGGQALKMGLLTQRRAKPMLRFGGKYRLIDFCLSIIANSGLEATAVLAQHHTAVLKAYLQEAKTWRLAMLEVWEPGNNSKYLGTADAVWQNHQRILSTGCEQVLVLSGDQVFRQNFAALAAFHQQKGGAVTIAALPVALEQAHRFGMLTVNADSKILTFNEKP